MDEFVEFGVLKHHTLHGFRLLGNLRAVLRVLYSQLTYLLLDLRENPSIHIPVNHLMLSKDTPHLMKQKHLNPRTCWLQRKTPHLRLLCYLRLVRKHLGLHFQSRITDAFHQTLAPLIFTLSACHLLKRKMIV